RTPSGASAPITACTPSSRRCATSSSPSDARVRARPGLQGDAVPYPPRSPRTTGAAHGRAPWAAWCAPATSAPAGSGPHRSAGSRGAGCCRGAGGNPGSGASTNFAPPRRMPNQWQRLQWFWGHMMQMHIVRTPADRRSRELLEAHYRLRHRIFVELQGWEALRRADGRDVDRFDNADATHLLLTD